MTEVQPEHVWPEGSSTDDRCAVCRVPRYSEDAELRRVASGPCPEEPDWA
jgi:hypothetical protein